MTDAEKMIAEAAQVAASGQDPLFAILRAAWVACDTQVERDTVQACIAALRLDQGIADEVVPITDFGSAFPASQPG